MHLRSPKRDRLLKVCTLGVPLSHPRHSPAPEMNVCKQRTQRFSALCTSKLPEPCGNATCLLRPAVQKASRSHLFRSICSWSPGLLEGILTTLSQHASRKPKLHREAYGGTLGDSRAEASLCVIPAQAAEMLIKKAADGSSTWLSETCLAICVVTAKTSDIGDTPLVLCPF